MHFNSELQPKDLLVSKFREASSVAGVDENFSAYSQGRLCAQSKATDARPGAQASSVV